MPDQNHLFFVYGMCSMFYASTAYFFWRKGPDRLSRLVTTLLLLSLAQCIKDLFFISDSLLGNDIVWLRITAVDMVIIPFYVFILKELCEPGLLTIRTAILNLAPYLILIPIFFATSSLLIFYIEVIGSAIYGTYYAVWTLFAAKRYNQRLKQRFSYDENINLGWLRTIVFSFFVILGLWLVDCFIINVNVEFIYLLGSLTLWIFLCYFIYRHNCVIDDLEAQEEPVSREPVITSDLSSRIEQLFEIKKIYLSPDLSLSDIAEMVGSNRTYVSRFFNNDENGSFFDYVNRYRIRHAVALLIDTDEKIESVAELSGFNSRQTFYRVFSKAKNMSPAQFRSSARQSS